MDSCRLQHNHINNPMSSRFEGRVGPQKRPAARHTPVSRGDLIRQYGPQKTSHICLVTSLRKDFRSKPRLL